MDSWKLDEGGIKMDDLKIGDNIVKICKENGISREVLAERLGKSVRQVSRYCNGQCNLTVKLLNQIADALDIPIEKLF